MGRWRHPSRGAVDQEKLMMNGEMLFVSAVCLNSFPLLVPALLEVYCVE